MAKKTTKTKVAVAKTKSATAKTKKKVVVSNSAKKADSKKSLEKAKTSSKVKISPKVKASSKVKVASNVKATPKVKASPKVKAASKVKVASKGKTTSAVKATTKSKTKKVTPKIKETPKSKSTSKIKATPKSNETSKSKSKVDVKGKSLAKNKVKKEEEYSALKHRKITPVSVEKQTQSPLAMTSEKPKNVGVPAAIRGKKRLLVSYEKMNDELAQAFKEKYPKGYADFMGDLFKVDKPDGSSFYAITMETEDTVYMIKMVVRIDRAEDAQNNLFPDTDADSGEVEGETFPDDNTENMTDADDDE